MPKLLNLFNKPESGEGWLGKKKAKGHERARRHKQHIQQQRGDRTRRPVGAELGTRLTLHARVAKPSKPATRPSDVGEK